MLSNHIFKRRSDEVSRLGRVDPEQVDADALRAKVQSRRVYIRVRRGIVLTLLLLSSPAALITIAVCSLLIAASMGQPIFFLQERIGRNGRVFKMVKLRTMRVHSQSERLATAKNDDRITPLGKFLRRSHLDELPQLWNVLRGGMSVVGPRPERPEFYEVLEREVPFWTRRHLVKPGITGWAQVHHGYTSDPSATAEKLSYDLYYLRHQGLVLDLAISVRTVATMLSGDGAV